MGKATQRWPLIMEITILVAKLLAIIQDFVFQFLHLNVNSRSVLH